jgi:hypothetical protein
LLLPRNGKLKYLPLSPFFHSIRDTPEVMKTLVASGACSGDKKALMALERVFRQRSGEFRCFMWEVAAEDSEWGASLH